MKIIYIFLFMLCFSCNHDNQNEKFIYAEGFFVVNNTLYFSNGKNFYCGFSSWEEFYKMRGKEDRPPHILNYDELPKDMKFIEVCNFGIVTKKFFE